MIPKMLKNQLLTALVLLILCTPFASYAQLPEHVASLLEVDRTAAHLSKTESPHKGLSYMIDKESSFFVPVKVNAKNYLDNRPNIPDVLSWKPYFALVSRSFDFGVTSGSIEFQRMGAIKRYGNYITIWKRDRKGRWKVNLRAEVENYGKQADRKMNYLEPDSAWYLKHRSKKRLGEREDIVLQTDQLYATVLKADNQTAFTEFLAEDTYFYYPWAPAMHKKEEVISYFKKNRLEIITEPHDVGRAYSGEYAYTSGTASVHTPEKVIKFNYIRVWQVDQESYEWKVLLEMLFER
ncbi:MAG TPA: hypothetical protein VK076_08895 [Candidatus Sphingobacterium stercoripullorum]|nr:hypothetical protein [Candidatus Sphingobacterium stercoripullorum]